MKRFAWIFILLIGITLRFAPTFAGKTLVFGDNISLLVPIKLYSASWLKQGVIPWWNPTIFAGVPWAEDISQSFFYPSTLLFVLLDPANALNVTVMLHLLFTGVGMHLLSKKLFHSEFESTLSSVLWTFSPQVTYSINNLSTIQSITWFPWVVLASVGMRTRRLGAAIFALVILGQFMAGYPQHVLYSIFSAVLLDIFLLKRNNALSWPTWFLQWIRVGVVVVGITAVAWIPFVRVLGESTRSMQNTTQALSGSLNPAQLPKVIIPYVFDLPLAGFRWGPAFSGFPQALFYFGLISLFSLGLFLKRNTFWLLVFSGLFLFSLGSYLPGFSLLFELLPPLKFARYPSMAMIPLVLFASVYIPKYLFSLGGIKHIASIKKVILLGLFASLATLLFILPFEQFSSLWIWIDGISGNVLSSSLFHTLARDHIILKIVLLDICIVLLFAWLLLWLLQRKRYLLATLLIALDVVVHTQGVLFFGPKTIVPTWKEIEAQQQEHAIQREPQSRAITNNSNQPYIDFGSYWEEMSIRKPFSDSAIDETELQTAKRLTQLISTYSPDWNMPFAIPIINGYTTLLPKDFAQIWQTSNDPRINFIDYINLDNPLLKQWSVDTLIVDNQFDPENQFREYPLLSETNSISVYGLDALPRIRYENDTEIEIQKYQENPNRINFQFNNSANFSSIIIADRYDKNWQALINGIPTPIQNHKGMRLVHIQPGTSSIEMRYWPIEFFGGILISISSLLVSSSALVSIHLMQRKKTT
jgi:hypothetical protein